MIDYNEGILIVVAGFVSFQGTFVGIIIPAYIILFGTLIIIMAFYIPPSLAAMIPFYMNFLGRGLTFLFLGCLVLVGTGNADVKLAVAIITLIVAFLYIILWILYKFNVIPCGLPPPFLQSDNAENNNKSGGGGSNNNDQAAAPPASDDTPDDTR